MVTVVVAAMNTGFWFGDVHHRPRLSRLDSRAVVYEFLLEEVGTPGWPRNTPGQVAHRFILVIIRHLTAGCLAGALAAAPHPVQALDHLAVRTKMGSELQVTSYECASLQLVVQTCVFVIRNS